MGSGLRLSFMNGFGVWWRTLNAMKSSLLLGYTGACDARQFVDGYHKWNLAASVDDALAIRVL